MYNFMSNFISYMLMNIHRGLQYFHHHILIFLLKHYFHILLHMFHLFHLFMVISNHHIGKFSCMEYKYFRLIDKKDHIQSMRIKSFKLMLKLPQYYHLLQLHKTLKLMLYFLSQQIFHMNLNSLSFALYKLYQERLNSISFKRQNVYSNNQKILHTIEI